ncbi:MAG: winged helix DNA-binding domain-containing protein [Nocardioides sp.]
MPTDHEIARWRLRSQHLVTPHAPDAAAAVSHLVAVQAENPSQSAWAVAARTATPDAADLNLLLASGAVIRTHVLRPTWHYVAADDVAWLIDVTAPRVRRSADHVMREVFGLARSRAEAAAGVLLDVLGEGRPLDRPTLAARVTDRGHDLTGQQLMMLLADLELQCLVCSGPPADGHHTYALFADRVPHPRRLDREEALAELALRYVAGHGPVTERDLAYWATLTLGDARAGLRAVADRLVSFEHHDRTFWHLPDQSPPSDAGEPRGHLLQVLDETYRGYQDSRWVLDAAGAVPRSRETAIGMALVDGQLVASMKRTVSAAKVTFALQAHDSWRPEHLAPVEQAAARYGAFLGLRHAVAFT